MEARAEESVEVTFDCRYDEELKNEGMGTLERV